MNRYADIKNYDELTASIGNLKDEIERKEKKLGEQYGKAKDFYSPSNIAYIAVRSIMSSVDWAALALKAVRKLKAAIEDKRE